MATVAALGPASANGRSSLGLTCLPPSATVETVCLQLRDVIASEHPNVSVTLAIPAEMDAFETAVRLHVETMNENGMSAYLEWRLSGGDWQRGETMALSVMDTSRNDVMTTRFLRDLWTFSQTGL